MTLPIPHFSQNIKALRLELPEDDAGFWSQNACGIICVRMTIAGLSGKMIPLSELLEFSKESYEFIDYVGTGEQKSLPIFTPEKGWLNYALVKKIAQKYGVFGRWYLDDKSSAKKRIQEALEKNHVVVASVRADFDTSRGPHMIIITGIREKDDIFFINDPLQTSPGEVFFDTFFSVFSGRLLVFSTTDTEEYRVMTPIVIEKSNNPDGHIAIIHIHGNEITASLHAKKIAQKSHLPFFALTQNGERFVRVSTGKPEIVTPETMFARLDANRIFSEGGLDLTIKTLNQHLKKEENITDIKLKGQKIAKTFLQSINHCNTWIVAHNNFSNEHEYEKYGNFFGMKSIPPLQSYLTITDYSKTCTDYFEGKTYAKNAFVLVNTRCDFETLKGQDINVVLTTGHDELGSLGEAASILGKRYFCIETGYENETARDEIFREILDVFGQK